MTDKYYCHIYMCMCVCVCVYKTLICVKIYYKELSIILGKDNNREHYNYIQIKQVKKVLQATAA